MNDTVCRIEALTLLRTMLDEPGVLYGPQRMPEFIAKVMTVATTMVTRQTKPVRELARLGVRHRFPFAKLATAKLCGVAKDSIPRILKILLKVGFLAEKSETKRWYEVGSLRSLTPGAKAFWRRPSIFQFGDAIACILAGTDIAASPFENQSALEVIPNAQRLELDDWTDQPIKEIEEIDSGTVQRALPPSAPTDFDDDDASSGLDDTADVAAEAHPEVSRQASPSGPKIRMPVAEARPQPTPAPDPAMTPLDALIARVRREIEEKGRAMRGG